MVPHMGKAKLARKGMLSNRLTCPRMRSSNMANAFSAFEISKRELFSGTRNVSDLELFRGTEGVIPYHDFSSLKIH